MLVKKIIVDLYFYVTFSKKLSNYCRIKFISLLIKLDHTSRSATFLRASPNSGCL